MSPELRVQVTVKIPFELYNLMSKSVNDKKNRITLTQYRTTKVNLGKPQYYLRITMKYNDY